MSRWLTSVMSGTTSKPDPAPVTHWQHYDAIVSNGTVRTPCGQRIPDREIVADPTCPTCKVACDVYNAVEV